MRSLLCVFVIAIAFVSQAKTVPKSGLFNIHTAVFYPTDFDSVANFPLFALVKELEINSAVPQNWTLRPVFYHAGTSSCAAFPISEGASLYGTGEVTGPLLRNGKSITLWNTDNYIYSKFDGARLYQSHPWVLGVNKDGSSFGILADNTWKQELILTDSIRFISEGPALFLRVPLHG